MNIFESIKMGLEEAIAYEQGVLDAKSTILEDQSGSGPMGTSAPTEILETSQDRKRPGVQRRHS